MASAACVTNKANQKITASLKELRQWHFRLRHIGFQHIQCLIRTVRLKVQENSTAVANCERPNFPACDFGKGHHRPNKGNKTKKNPIKEQDLKKDNIMPG